MQDIQALLANVRSGRAALAASTPYIEQNKRAIASLLRRLTQGLSDSQALPRDKCRPQRLPPTREWDRG